MKTSEILEVIAAPEVQMQRDKLYQLGAPVGKLQQEAIMQLQTDGTVVTKDDAVVFIANCLLQRVKEWEAKREPKTRVGKFIKWFVSIFPAFKK